MTPTEWAGLAVAVMTLVTGVATSIRWLVKHYLNELKPYGGSSMKDKVDRLDEKVELLTDLVKQVLSR